MLIEECSEVIKAVCKIWRNEPLAKNEFIKELVDLQLMVDQAKFILELNHLEKQYDTEMTLKLERLKELLTVEKLSKALEDKK
jgi:hypothetical protein